ncbi:protein CLP1 homolog isoform X2 [Cornus florida]|nr:protein CLP1 homolog isoform X2 [Cornus florida]
MDGNTETDCTADETPMISYANVHAVLKGRRNRAKASPSDSDSSQGPGVIVVGPTDSGKSTLSRMLLSWAAKQDLYKVLMKELAQILERQFAGNTESRAAGMVINTMGWIDGVGYEMLLHAIETFNATVVLVLGQERETLQHAERCIEKQAQCGRCETSKVSRCCIQKFKSPSEVQEQQDKVYCIGGGPQAPRSALPIGAEPAADPTWLVPVSINRDLIHLVLAVSFAKKPDQIISR